MENQRILAAKQFVSNLIQKAPIVQAVQQKSFRPLLNTLEPANILPMGRANKFTKLAYNPKWIAQGTRAAEKDMAAYTQQLREAAQRADIQRKALAARQSYQTGMQNAWSGFLKRKF
jgi:hypothetical protein